jgi:hypothetical protein
VTLLLKVEGLVNGIVNNEVRMIVLELPPSQCGLMLAQQCFSLYQNSVKMLPKEIPLLGALHTMAVGRVDKGF